MTDFADIDFNELNDDEKKELIDQLAQHIVKKETTFAKQIINIKNFDPNSITDYYLCSTDKGYKLDNTLIPKDTILAIAAGCGNYALTELLLQKGANPNLLANEYAIPPLMRSVESQLSSLEKINLLKLLINKKADINLTSRYKVGDDYSYEVYQEGYTALLLATELHEYEVVEYLLQRGANPTLASKYNDLNKVRELAMQEKVSALWVMEPKSPIAFAVLSACDGKEKDKRIFYSIMEYIEKDKGYKQTLSSPFYLLDCASICEYNNASLLYSSLASENKELSSELAEFLIDKGASPNIITTIIKLSDLKDLYAFLFNKNLILLEKSIKIAMFEISAQCFAFYQDIIKENIEELERNYGNIISFDDFRKKLLLFTQFDETVKAKELLMVAGIGHVTTPLSEMAADDRFKATLTFALNHPTNSANPFLGENRVFPLAEAISRGQLEIATKVIEFGGATRKIFTEDFIRTWENNSIRFHKAIEKSGSRSFIGTLIAHGMVNPKFFANLSNVYSEVELSARNEISSFKIKCTAAWSYIQEVTTLIQGFREGRDREKPLTWLNGDIFSNIIEKLKPAVIADELVSKLAGVSRFIYSKIKSIPEQNKLMLELTKQPQENDYEWIRSQQFNNILLPKENIQEIVKESQEVVACLVDFDPYQLKHTARLVTERLKEKDKEVGHSA
jgi:ankyrin repeat protein